MMTIETIIKLAKDVLIWSKKYWERSQQFGLVEYTEQDINEAFNKWNWAETDLRNAIIQYEDEQNEVRKRNLIPEWKKIKFFNNKLEDTKMNTDKEKQFTRLTYESSYGIKNTIELNTEDPQIEDLIDSFYSMLIGATWQERTILESLKAFAESKLRSIERDPER